MKKKFFTIMLCISLIFCVTALSSAKHYHYKKSTICWIQQDLKNLGYYQGKITGIMDEATIKAIKAFQKDKGLKVDGIPGPKTRAALKKALKEKGYVSKTHEHRKEK